MDRSYTETAVVVQADGSSMVIDSADNAESGDFIRVKMGMQFPRKLSYERWKTIGHQLASVGRWSAWCLGDWLVHGEEAYSGRYRDAVDQSGLDYQTLRNYAWVARRFDLSRRRDTLSLAHHAEVASLPQHEQDFWLRKAEEARWSRNRLRKEVRASLAERSALAPSDSARADEGEAGVGCDADRNDRAAVGVETESSGGSAAEPSALSFQLGPPGGSIQVRLSAEQMKSCQAAAERLGRSIEEWVSSALDRAARNSLRPGFRGLIVDAAIAIDRQMNGLWSRFTLSIFTLAEPLSWISSVLACCFFPAFLWCPNF